MGTCKSPMKPRKGVLTKRSDKTGPKSILTKYNWNENCVSPVKQRPFPKKHAIALAIAKQENGGVSRRRRSV